MADDFSDPELRAEIKSVGLHSEEAESIMKQAMADTARQAKAIAPRRTGKMAGRIRWSVADSIGGITGTVSAPAPANLLSTRKGLRHQTRAYGRVVSLWHPAHNPFLRIAFAEVGTLYGEPDEVST